MAPSASRNLGPVFPPEIMDLVIDQFHSDIKMLGVCGMICSEWLTRSRYRIFATVRLLPWRAYGFFKLSHAPTCTFTKHVNCIEIDDASARTGQEQTSLDNFPFHKIITSSLVARLSHIKALRIRNVDWTLLPPSDQDHLRIHFATFTDLKSLEFDDVMFHDLRELARIAALFPSLCHLVTKVQFLKYIEHTLPSAAALTLPKCLDTLRLGTDDAIPVLLSTQLDGLKLYSLSLDDVKFWHLQYIGKALRSLGGQLRHLAITFSNDNREWTSNSDLAHLDLHHQRGLQSLNISGVCVPNQLSQQALGLKIPSLVAEIPSPSNLKHLTVCITLESDSALRSFGWVALERSLNRHDQCYLTLDIIGPWTSVDLESELKEYICTELKTLWTGGRLNIHVLQCSTRACH